MEKLHWSHREKYKDLPALVNLKVLGRRGSLSDANKENSLGPLAPGKGGACGCDSPLKCSSVRA